MERQHRIDEARFYKWMKMYSLEDGRKQLAVYQKKSNNYIKTCLGMKTPTGVYSLHTPFGIKSNPGCKLGYTKVTANHYWGGKDAQYYNKMVDTSKVPEYEPGNAIFIHCQGKGTTAGCISIPEKDMIVLLKNLKSDAKIIIDYSGNISNY